MSLRAVTGSRATAHGRLFDALEEGQDKRGRPMDQLRQASMRVLTQEGQRLADHMAWLNREIAWLAARWAVEQAKAATATLIAIENLDDLEPSRLDKRRRTRVSAQVRGLAQEHLEYLAAREGIRVLKVGTAVPSPDGTVCQSRTNKASRICRARASAAGPLDGTRYALRTRARFSPVRSCRVGSVCRRRRRVRRLQLIC